MGILLLPMTELFIKFIKTLPGVNLKKKYEPSYTTILQYFFDDLWFLVHGFTACLVEAWLSVPHM